MKRAVCGLSVIATLAGCATPATTVKVPTMSVQDAWRAGETRDVASLNGRVVSPAMKAPAPYPVISPPEIRLAYVKPWKDAEGNLHYGNWIAIQLYPARWQLPDGSVDAVDRRGTANAPARQP